MADVIVTVLFDGKPLVEVLSDGTHRTVSAGVNEARIKGSALDVSTKIGPLLAGLQKQVKCGMINPYRDACLSTMDVWKAIPRLRRGALRVKEVSAVLDAVVRIAKRSEQ
jgi:hypothetical protein